MNHILAVYATLILLHILLILFEKDAIKSVLRVYFIGPYNEGIRLGDIFSLIFWLPSIIISLMLLQSAPLIYKLFTFLFNFQITKSKEKK